MALHQHLALEGVALHRVAAGIKQECVAAEDLPVTEQDHAAALARTSVQQVDVDRIKPVLHDISDATVPGRGAPAPLCQPGGAASTRQLGRWCRPACDGFEAHMTKLSRHSGTDAQRPDPESSSIHRLWISGFAPRRARWNDERLTRISCRAPTARPKYPAALGW